MFGRTQDDYGDDTYKRVKDNMQYYSVMINFKGVEIELVKIIVQFAMLDLSSNHFHGETSKSFK